MKDPKRGYFDPRDIYSALPKALVSKRRTPRSPSTRQRRARKPLAGRAHRHRARVHGQAQRQRRGDERPGQRRRSRRVLRDRLGASSSSRSIRCIRTTRRFPNMTYTFQQALAEILPFHMPEFLQRRGRRGHADLRRAGLRRHHARLHGEGRRRAGAVVATLNMRSINDGPPSASFGFNLAQYLLRRGDARVKDWASLNANATVLQRVAGRRDEELGEQGRPRLGRASPRTSRCARSCGSSSSR